MEYIRICKTVNDFGKLVPSTDDLYQYVDLEMDYYRSIFTYSEEHYKQFLEKNSVSGIEDVVSNKLVFDLDKDGDLTQAKNDAITIYERLKAKGLTEDSIQLFFSGDKGFHVEVDLDLYITPKQCRNIAFSIAKDLVSFDPKIYNASRIIRLPFTKHQKSGLYKAPFTVEDLKELNIEEIRKFSSRANRDDVNDYKKYYKPTHLPESLATVEYKEERPVVAPSLDKLEINWTTKPKWLSQCKYHLSRGNFAEGNRDDVFTCLAATYKNQGFPEPVIYNMLIGVAEMQATENNCEIFHERDIRKCTRSVFKETWKGGEYSCKKDGWLRDYCGEHGFDCSKEPAEIDNVVIDTSGGLSKFTEYAINIDSNTIKFGINELDRLLRVQVGHLVGVLAPPAAGKISFALTVLNNTSKEGVDSLFLSYDMHSAILFQKLIQRETGLNSEQVYEIYKNKNIEEITRIEKLLHDNYEHVGFCFKSGQTIEQIKNTIKYREERLGRPIRLVVVDYLELIQGPFFRSYSV